MVRMFEGLKQIDYNGCFTIHQAQGITTRDEARAYAARCAQFVRDNEG
jgi:sugar phosphate isomerase/epimerase